MFQFTLQTILDVRNTIAEKALIEFSSQQRELQKEKELLQAIREQIAGYMESLRGLSGKTVRTDDITLHTIRISASRREEEKQLKRIEAAGLLLEKKKAALIKATRDRKSMEILKAKHYEKYLFETNQLEQMANDEITIVRHGRREE